MTAWFPSSISGRCYCVLLVLLAVAPWIFQWTDQPFLLDLLSRGLILAIAATSLNLIMGYGGMVSLGHAAFIGIGAYCVGIPAYYDLYNGWFHLGLTIVVSAVFALLAGAVSLRTRGVYFIMITLAFSQMVYFAFVSLEEYGGDDGLVIYLRSEFPDFLTMQGPVALYYWIFATLLLTLFLVHRLVRARFGRVIAGAKHNEQRMQSLGFDTYRYRLTCYVISGVTCGLAGMLLGNFTGFISPEMMSWIRSGELIFMVVMGGSGFLFGPLVGTGAFVILEQYLPEFMKFLNPSWLEYWHLPFGLLLVLLVLFGKGGIHGMLSKLDSRTRQSDR
ncbi:MAG: branched-chain amino acid ABC transporter permease [Gammaproteobacteria bacterium]|nr:branched-chain amino acid ABC transporter permease [Gammaproteobacteria bacterium]MCY4229222.1 branched-chain amino acid ABC transporter permease [Gammaproteobacteria bacterium]